MAGRQNLIPLVYGNSKPYLLNPSLPLLYNPFKLYGQASKGSERQERAPSIAEEFKRVAEEKAREAQQGVASQTLEKVYDGAEEATTGDSEGDSVKGRYKDHHEQGADYHKKGN